MIHRNMKIIAEKVPWMMGIKIFMGDFIPNSSKISILKSMEFEAVEQGDYMESPFVLSNGEAQQLMDSLWDCGLRPSEGSGSAGALLATQNHLESMKEFADRLLKLVERG